MNVKLIILLILTSSNLYSQDWEFKREQEGIQVYTADREGSGFKHFKATATVEANLEQMKAIFRDISNMHTWYDSVAENRLLQKIDVNEAIYTLILDMPWPVKDRASVIRAKMETFDNGFEVRTQYDNSIKNPLSPEDYVLVHDIGSSWIVKSIDDKHVSITHQGYMDPAGSVPAWLAENSVEKGPIKTIQNLRKAVRNY